MGEREYERLYALTVREPGDSMTEAERTVLVRINALIAEGCAHYQARGLPAADVGEEALLRYAFDRLTEAERVAFGLFPQAEMEAMFAVAAFSNMQEDIAEAEGKPLPPVVPEELDKDPERARFIMEAKQSLRARDEEEAYWRGDNAADERDHD